MKSSHLAEAEALTDERTPPPAIFRRMFIFSPAGLRQHLSSRPLYRSCDSDLSLLHLRFHLPILSAFPSLQTIHCRLPFSPPGHATPCFLHVEKECEGLKAPLSSFFFYFILWLFFLFVFCFLPSTDYGPFTNLQPFSTTRWAARRAPRGLSHPAVNQLQRTKRYKSLL